MLPLSLSALCLVLAVALYRAHARVARTRVLLRDALRRLRHADALARRAVRHEPPRGVAVSADAPVLRAIDRTLATLAAAPLMFGSPEMIEAHAVMLATLRACADHDPGEARRRTHARWALAWRQIGFEIGCGTAWARVAHLDYAGELMHAAVRAFVGPEAAAADPCTCTLCDQIRKLPLGAQPLTPAERVAAAAYARPHGSAPCVCPACLAALAPATGVELACLVAGIHPHESPSLRAVADALAAAEPADVAADAEWERVAEQCASWLDGPVTPEDEAALNAANPTLGEE